MNDLIDALRRMKSAAGQDALQALLSAGLDLLAEGKRHTDRALAANLLGDIGHPDAVVGLLTAQEDEHATVRYAAANALVQIGGDGASTAIRSLLQSNDPSIQRMALFAVVMDGLDVRVPPEELTPFLTDRDPSVRQQTIHALRNTGSSDAVPYLLNHLKDPDSRVALEAAKALSVIHTADAITPLDDIARDETAYYLLRGAAIHALSRIDASNTLNYLFDYLTEPDIYIRQQVIEALPTIGTEKQVEQLLQAADFHRSLVRPTKDALIRAGGEAVESVMIRQLDHLREWVRSLAVEVLGELGSTQAVPRLLTVLRQDEPEIRVLAANALGQIGTEDAVHELAEALIDDDSWLVEMAAASALRRINTPAARAALDAWHATRGD
jgi:HEAT repeat protein